MMVKPLVFKGEKRSKKRKAPSNENAVIENDNLNNTTTVTTASHEAQNPTNAEIIDDDSWVSAETPSDIVGPVLLVLSSVPPTCVACDQNGKVYASVVENIIDGQPATAEPHDMRQVWIASTVAGTERIGFKGHHGRYLKCDKFGLLSADQEAISAEESFLCTTSSSSPDDISGTFNIQSESSAKFLAVVNDVKGPEIRGDAEIPASSSNDNNDKATALHIRMQARFKPKLKASKDSKAREKVSRKQLEEVVGRRLDDEEVRKLKKARVRGDYHEAILDVRVKGKHDKYA